MSIQGSNFKIEKRGTVAIQMDQFPIMEVQQHIPAHKRVNTLTLSDREKISNSSPIKSQLAMHPKYKQNFNKEARRILNGEHNLNESKIQPIQPKTEIPLKNVIQMNKPKLKAQRRFKPKGRPKNSDLDPQLIQGKVSEEAEPQIQLIQTTRFSLNNRKSSNQTMLRAGVTQYSNSNQKKGMTRQPSLHLKQFNPDYARQQLLKHPSTNHLRHSSPTKIAFG